MFRLIANNQLRRAEQQLIDRYVRCYTLLSRRVTQFDEWSRRVNQLRVRFEREAVRLERGLV